MVKKHRMARSFARTAPKSQEKHLIENAKKLQQDPFLLLPTCTNDSEKYFKKLHRQLEKIHRFRNDENKLEKLSHKKGLDGALAGTYLLALSEKAPYLAALSFPTGDVVYAQRGKADKHKLIAVQHFDDPVFRLRGIIDLVTKKQLHVYSWDNGYICTGKTASPPKEFIEFVRNKIDNTATKDVLSCPHIPPETAEKKGYITLNYLHIDWKPAHTIVSICENCSKSTKNTMFTISKYMLQKNLSDDFTIQVITQVGEHSSLSERQKTTVLQEYLTGRLTDYEFIKKIAKSQEENIQQTEEKIYVLDGISFGADTFRFIDALQPTAYEKTALEFMLQKNQEPLIVSKTTPGKIIERFWNQYGKEYLQTIIDDTQTAESLFKLDDAPLNIILLAYDYKQRRTILAQLPHYDTLPPLAAFADTVARTYRTFGEKNALAEIKKHPDSPKGKSIAYAFLLTLGKGAEVKWKYSKEEIEYGEFLKNHTKKLLDVTPEEYGNTLQELLIMCGSSETIPQ